MIGSYVFEVVRGPTFECCSRPCLGIHTSMPPYMFPYQRKPIYCSTLLFENLCCRAYGTSAMAFYQCSMEGNL